MIITGIAPWFGAKRRLAHRIVYELGPHKMYWEPFCGSMTVLLQKPEATCETVCDLHLDLTNLGRIIQHPVDGAKLYRRLRRVWMNEVFMRESATELEKPFEPGLERAFHYFVVSWMGRNGISGTMVAAKPTFAVRYTPGGGQGGQRLRSAVDSIPSWGRRMRRLVIMTKDSLNEVIPKISDGEGIAVYVDPPYPDEKRTGVGSPAATYVHDFTGQATAPTTDLFERRENKHSILAGELARFTRTRVVVSTYDCQSYRDLYRGWAAIPCPINKSSGNASKRDKDGEAEKAPELLLVNGPAYTESCACGDKCKVCGRRGWVLTHAGRSAWPSGVQEEMEDADEGCWIRIPTEQSVPVGMQSDD